VSISAVRAIPKLLLICLAVVPSAVAQVPMLSPGGCHYLVGAPAGTVAAPSEQAEQGGGVSPICPVAGNTAWDRDRPHSLQSWVVASGGSLSCVIDTWTGNDFEVGGTASTTAEITINGGYAGSIATGSSPTFRTVILRAVLVRVDRRTNTEAVGADEEVVHTWTQSGTYEPSGPYGR
jgi:hypothetical protein